MRMENPADDRVFIDPFTDFGFKRIFGSEGNKDLLIDFLNAILGGYKQITDLTYNRNEYLGQTKDSRKVIYDLLCTDNHGARFIVEVQRMEQEYFRERCVFYTSAFVCDQLRRGMKGWDYRLKEVYLVGIMNFCFDDTRAEKYIHDIYLADRQTHDPFYQKLGYLFVEIPKFHKSETELTCALDNWLYVLKNMHVMKEIPVFLNSPVFSKLFNIALMSNLTTEERSLYDRELFSKWDLQNVQRFMRKKARKDGRAEGRAEGREEGKEQTLQLLVRNCKAKGLSIDTIADITGLSPEEVAKMD